MKYNEDLKNLKIESLIPVDSLINYHSEPGNKPVNSSKIKCKSSSVENGMFNEHNVYRVVNQSKITASNSASVSSGIMTASDLNENEEMYETAYLKNKEKIVKERDLKIYKLSEQIGQIKTSHLTERDCKMAEFEGSLVDMLSIHEAKDICSNDKKSEKVDKNALKRKQQTAWSSNFAKNVPKTLQLPRRKKFSGVKSKLNSGASVTSSNYGRNYQSSESKRKKIFKESQKDNQKKQKVHC